MAEHLTSQGVVGGKAVVVEEKRVDVEGGNIVGAQDCTAQHYAENGAESHSTPSDVRNMQRMGKTQQLVRNFHVFTIASFAAIALAAWELGIFVITPALVDGGIPSLMYNMLWTFIGFWPIYLSMAEMSSMAPIAGSQYHWVSEFAPERYQKILSYLTGWTSTIAWQAGNAFGIFLVGSIAQAIITINLPDYSAPSWHATLLVIGGVAITLLGNIYGFRTFHLWQGALFTLHIAMYFVFIIPIWVKVPRVSHQAVWGDFQNFGGWSSMALTVFVGQLSGISAQVGCDTVAHMSEEVQDAGRQVPRAMLMVYVINFVVTFPCFVTLAYHISDVSDALADPTSYPVIFILRQCWSTGAITAILIIIAIIVLFSNILYLAAVTRDLFAFARDNGFPFASWLSRVDQKRAIPTNATYFTCVVGIALSLIYLGSPVAFYAITSLSTVALLQCYCLSIGCVLWRRIYHPETLPPAPFSLGRWGIPINIAAVAFSIWSFFWSFWPQATPVTAEGFNWASVLFVSTLLVAMIYYVFQGRKVYHGPVMFVEGRKAG